MTPGGAPPCLNAAMREPSSSCRYHAPATNEPLLHQTAHRVRNLLEGGASRGEAVRLELVLETLAWLGI